MTKSTDTEATADKRMAERLLKLLYVMFGMTIGMFLMLTLLNMSNYLVSRDNFHCEVESKFYGCKVFVANDVSEPELRMYLARPEESK